MPRSDDTRDGSLVLLGVAFFLSGAAALVYQVAWQRILTLHTGIGIVSISLIVAAFMAGLGLGSEAGGLLSARVSPRRALRLFGAIELAVGLFALASCRLYYDGLGALAHDLYRTTAGSAAAHFAALLVPTTLMGMSLPFLVRATVRETASAPRVIARLYGVNVLGAATGALLAPWVLVRYFGLEGAAWWGAAANLAAAAAAFGTGVARGTEAEAPRAPAGGEAVGPAERASFRLWLALYALSGFLALSLEVLWFRLMDVSAKGTAYTFGVVLCVYLLGLGAGSLLGARVAPRLERPLAAFLDCQLALLVLAGLAVVLLVRLPPDAPVYRFFFEYWRQEPWFQLGSDWNPGLLARLYALLPLALFGVPTLLMGLSFGALQRAVQDDPATSGRKVGLLQAANIGGCTAGSLAAGLLLIERLGTAGTLRLLVVAGGLAFLLVRARREGLTRALAGRAAALAVVALLLPGQQELWKRLHGVVADEPPSFIGEDASAVSVVVPGVEGRWRVVVNGMPHSWLPFDGIHTLLGAIPALVHPGPKSVLVVGLGSGETAWAVACRPETRTLRVYEIAASQPRLLEAVSRQARLPALRQLLEDPRLALRAADGRRALAASSERYDLIQVDALFLSSAGSGNLYSVEFFRLCASRLARGGVVCTQKPARRVGLSFAEALPHALDFGNVILGSNDPLPIDLAAWEARLDRPETAARFDAATREGILDRLRDARPLHRNPGARIGHNRDLFPRDEFGTPPGW
jgi:predicted membrane-bound spermidine synthase